MDLVVDGSKNPASLLEERFLYEEPISSSQDNSCPIQATIESSKHVHVGNKIVYNVNVDEKSRSGSIHTSNNNLSVLPPALLEDLVGYLRTSFRNAQAWICPLPWTSSEEYHLEKMFINPLIYKTVLGNKGWCVDETETLYYKQILLPRKNHLYPPKRILISGDPGFGKSTVLKKLAYDWAVEKEGYLCHFKLVFLLKLRYMNLDLHDTVVEQVLQDLKWHGHKDVLWDYIRQHQSEVLFLLDGYDEMTEEQKSVGTISRLLSGVTVPEATVVITSRPVAVCEIIKHCDRKCELRGISELNVNKFLSQFFHSEDTLEGAEQEKNFISFLMKLFSTDNVSLKFLTQNPMMLHFLCALLKQNQSLSISVDMNRTCFTTGVYLGILECLFERCLLRNSYLTLYSKQAVFHEMLQELGSLCLCALKTGNYKLEESKVSNLKFAACLKEMGLLHLVSQTKGKEQTLELMHTSFYDFLASYYLNSLSAEKRKCELNNFFKTVTMKKETLPLQMFVFLVGLLRDNAYQFTSCLPFDIYGALNRTEIIKHACQLASECTDTDENFYALQHFLPENLVLDNLITMHSTASIIPGIVRLLASPTCRVKQIVICSDTMLDFSITGKDAYHKLLSGLKKNTSIVSVDFKMYTSFGRFEIYENMDILKTGFSEFCCFGLDGKELEEVKIKFDTGLEAISREVFALLSKCCSLKILHLENHTKHVKDVKVVDKDNLDSSLKQCNNIQSLTLKGMKYSLEEWKLVASILEEKKVKSLAMSTVRNTRHKENIKRKFKRAVCFRREIRCSDSPSHVSEYHNLFSFLHKKQCVLQKLDLSENILQKEDIICLTAALIVNKSLRVLILHNSLIKFNYLCPLFNTLRLHSKCITLEELFLGSAIILKAKEQVVHALSLAVKTTVSLKTLTLKGWNFEIVKEETVQNLINSLNTSCLVNVKVVNCCFSINLHTVGIKDSRRGSELSFPVQIHSKNLKCLHVDGIQVQIDEGPSISWIAQFKSFSFAQNLQELQLIYRNLDDVGDDEFKQLWEILHEMKNLKRLELSTCGILIKDPESCLFALKEAIFGHELEHLSLHFKIECKKDFQHGSFNEVTFFHHLLFEIVSCFPCLTEMSFFWINLAICQLQNNSSNNIVIMDPQDNFLWKNNLKNLVKGLCLRKELKLLTCFWPRSVVNELINIIKQFRHLNYETVWDKQKRLTGIILKPKSE
ncbi:uncharacterized protein LOC106472113 isoform X2 [Limulus polyphemus]|nr:uncharacterized protein LOC106472113 isoform X2 [Limulus polyphemus]XP_022256426.1 uncharacterized protein LOC106472113 isoform X2 [Limulus polyphemus]XP_022256427.1 uncharacterized protein LOC106472113 isoform X2 [Limulus polyphemus]XP_022256428.1 uncharacterized protein LOC106472113 isoform X2 [Limulus polyphemus]